MSNWSLLAEIDVSNDWEYSPVTDHNVFRLSYQDPFNIVSVILAQAEFGSRNQLYNLQRLAVREEYEILAIEKPSFFEQRRIGLKAIAQSDKRPPSLVVTLESQLVQLLNPVNIAIPDNTIATGAGSSVAHSTTSVVLLAAKSSRRGFTIWNSSSTAIAYVGMGFTPTTTSYSFQLAPGAFFAGPNNFTGAVNAISSAATGNMLVTELG